MILIVNLVIGFMAWVAVCKLIQWKWNLSLESTSYAVAFVHGFLACRLCEYSIFTEELWSIEKIGGPVSPFQNGIITVSAAYFYYDIIICFLIKAPLFMKAHHLFAILIFTTTLMMSHSGPEVIICLWLGEFTNACLNIRYWFEHHERFCKSKVSLVNDVAFAVFFIALRFIVCSYVIFYILTLGRSLIIVQIGSICFTVVNLIMGKMIFTEAMDLFFPCKKKNE